MEHSLKAYLKRLTTETLENFLQNCQDEENESYHYVLNDIVAELARRKREET